MTKDENDPPDFDARAWALLDLLESDFGQSGRDARLEAIRCELEAVYYRRADLTVTDSAREQQ